MTSTLETLGSLVPTKMILGSKDDAAEYARRYGWRVEDVDPSAGLQGCFSKALQSGAPHILLLSKGVRSAEGGNASAKLKELYKLLDTPFDAISLGTCVDSNKSLVSWGGCDTFKRAAGYQFIFETNCTCTVGTIYSSGYMQRYMQRAHTPDRAYTFVPELLLRARDTRPIHRVPTVVYDPYDGRVAIPSETAFPDHAVLVLLTLALLLASQLAR